MVYLKIIFWDIWLKFKILNCGKFYNLCELIIYKQFKTKDILLKISENLNYFKVHHKTS